MANFAAGNMQQVDTDGVLFDAPTRVSYIIAVATSASGTAELKDPRTGNILMTIKIAATGTMEYLDFEARPLTFPNGIEIDNLANMKLTLVYRRD